MSLLCRLAYRRDVLADELIISMRLCYRYLLPNSVIQYISKNLLYREPDTKAIQS